MQIRNVLTTVVFSHLVCQRLLRKHHVDMNRKHRDSQCYYTINIYFVSFICMLPSAFKYWRERENSERKSTHSLKRIKPRDI